MEVHSDEVKLLRAEVERLRAENCALRERLEQREVLPATESANVPSVAVPVPAQESNEVAALHAGSPPEEKVRLFTQLFRGREDVYAARWAGKDGRSGYSPSCAHEWDRFYCAKPRIKCAACAHREYRPLTDEVITEHLTGKKTIGVYAMLPDETCRLLVADFDGSSWMEDAAAFLQSAQRECRHISSARAQVTAPTSGFSLRSLSLPVSRGVSVFIS